MIKEFKVNFTEKEISLIYQKVKDYPWNSVKDLDGWEHGTNKKYLKELCDYWITKFDWSKHELEMNKFKNYTTNIDGIKIHFIKKKGSSENSEPLLLMHGWPGSIIEFLNIIEKLAHPEKFGGNEKDSFDVIVLHYSIYTPLSLFFHQDDMRKVRGSKAHKVLFIQDEYRQVLKARDFINFLGIDTIYTLADSDCKNLCPH